MAYGLKFLTIFMIFCHSSSSVEVHNWLTDFSKIQSESNVSKIQGLSRSKREAIAVNELADPIIDDFRKKLISKNESIVAVSNLTKSLSFKIFGKNITYLSFTGYNAKIKDISTIYRIGDVSLKKDERGLTVSFRFGFWTLEYYCDTYLFKFTWFKFSGHLRVTVDESEVFFEGTVHKRNGTCKFEVVTMLVVKLEGVKVRMSGFSVLDRLVNLVVEKVLEFFKETIKRAVEKELVNSLTKAIEKTGVCMREQPDF